MPRSTIHLQQTRHRVTNPEADFFYDQIEQPQGERLPSSQQPRRYYVTTESQTRYTKLPPRDNRKSIRPGQSKLVCYHHFPTVTSCHQFTSYSRQIFTTACWDSLRENVPTSDKPMTSTSHTTGTQLPHARIRRNKTCCAVPSCLPPDAVTPPRLPQAAASPPSCRRSV